MEKVVKTCDDCETEYDQSNIQCAYCFINPMPRVDNFRIKPLKFDQIDFGNIVINNWESLLKNSWSWDIVERKKNKYSIILYFNDFELTGTKLFVGHYTEVYDWVKKDYNLP